MNTQKSEILNIALPTARAQALQSSFSFPWVASSLTYLGVKLTSSIDKVFQANFPPLIREFSSDLERWNKGPYTWMGRNAILKMNILPRLLYLLQTLPIAIPESFLKSIRSIWAKKHPRLSFNLLAMPKSRGGMAFPDPIRYYKAIHLARVLAWCRDEGHKTWIAIEQSCTEIPLRCLPWLQLKTLGTLRHHPLIGATLKVIQQSHFLSRFDGEITRLHPVLGNPRFPSGYTDNRFKQIMAHCRFRLGNFLEASRLKTRSEMQSLFCPSLDPWRMQQLTHFLTSLNRGERSDRLNTPLENVCLLEEPSAHGVSEVYKILIDPPEDFVPRISFEMGKRSGHYTLQRAKELYFTLCSLLLNCQQIPGVMLQNSYKVV